MCLPLAMAFLTSVARRSDTSEEAQVHQGFQFQQAGQPELVLYHSVFDACRLGEREEFERDLEAVGDRLLAVVVLASGEGFFAGGGGAVGVRRVKVDGIGGASED